MSDTTLTARTWLAQGPAGTIGWITKMPDGYTFTLRNDSQPRSVYPSLEVAKAALQASLVPGSDRPEFVEH
ncbi:MAG: methyltransferase [Microbacteriaceae bacterium]|jgi:hypothetical protein|nr:methyltransferase [Microbacteriaceae bacterium]